jgi:glycosyltransferase involved in cell wall biosynthesis
MTVRTLFLNHSATMGGAEFGLLDIVRSVRDSSLVVLLEDGPFRKRLEEAGVAVRIIEADAIHRVRRGSRAPSVATLAALWRAAREVGEMAADFDVIGANSQKALVVGSIAARRTRTPLLWHLHDIIEPPYFSRLNIKADVVLANQCTDRVIAVSQATADAFVRQGGDPAKVHVVYNGIDAPPDDPLAPNATERRAALGLADVPVVGCFSRIAEWKGQHVLVEAVAPLEGVHVLLVGGALFGEHAYESTLRDLVSSLGMTDRVHFLGQRDDVPALMQCVDFIVHPSTAPEPFARTLIEAMLTGRAPIASACGGVPELIHSGVNGYLFPPSDAVALREILRRVLVSPSEVQRTAEAARQHAQTHFSRSAFVSAMTAHLEAAAMSRRTMRPSHRAAEVVA